MRCKNCEAEITEPSRTPCPYCGATARAYFLVAKPARFEVRIGPVRMITKRPGVKKPLSEVFVGPSMSAKLGRDVDKYRNIDRTNDWYEERITDPVTGEVIHEQAHRLSEHIGHGSAKQKK
jgi:hypothetical protein